MKKPEGSPRTDLSTAIGFLIDRRGHPDWYASHVLPWEQFVAAPTWRMAKQLIKVDADHVSIVVERFVADALGSRNPEAWLCLGKVRQDRGDYRRAIEAFVYLVERDQDHKALYNVGVCLAALGESDNARQAFLQVLELRPGDIYATRALAVPYS